MIEKYKKKKEKEDSFTTHYPKEPLVTAGVLDLVSCFVV